MSTSPLLCSKEKRARFLSSSTTDFLASLKSILRLFSKSLIPARSYPVSAAFSGSPWIKTKLSNSLYTSSTAAKELSQSFRSFMALVIVSASVDVQKSGSSLVSTTLIWFSRIATLSLTSTAFLDTKTLPSFFFFACLLTSS